MRYALRAALDAADSIERVRVTASDALESAARTRGVVSARSAGETLASGEVSQTADTFGFREESHMKIFALSRYSVSIAAAPALLAACGGMQPPMGAPSVIAEAQSHHQTFDYTGKKQTFKVPAGVKLITVAERRATI